MDLLSLAIGFVVGTFTGAAGQYFGDKYTDKRRRIEQSTEEDRAWNDIVTRFPKIIGEMKEDARNPDLQSAREFFVKSRNTTVNRSKPGFEYHTDVHVDLHAAITLLERRGYIEDITIGNCPMYRMNEDFVDRLRNA